MGDKTLNKPTEKRKISNFHHILKGESGGQACRSYMIVNVIVKDRQNFFFHFMIPPSAGGLPGQFVLA